MTLEIRIINFKLAMQKNKPKGIVRYKFRKYMEEYDNADKTVLDKIRHKDLSMDYFRYMSKSGEGEDIQRKRDLSKEDVKMHYNKEDKGKDYFEHLDPEDIPESEK